MLTTGEMAYHDLQMAFLRYKAEVLFRWNDAPQDECDAVKLAEYTRRLLAD